MVINSKCGYKMIVPPNKGKGGQGNTVITVAKILYSTVNVQGVVQLTNNKKSRRMYMWDF